MKLLVYSTGMGKVELGRAFLIFDLDTLLTNETVTESREMQSLEAVSSEAWAASAETGLSTDMGKLSQALSASVFSSCHLRADIVHHWPQTNVMYVSLREYAQR